MNAINRLTNARLIIFASLWLVALPGTPKAIAATFEIKRGISMDQWVTWPNESSWNDAEIIDNFPQWQSFVSDAEIASLKAAGLSTVRMPIDPAMLLHDDDVARTERLFASIHRAINRLQSAGLNVIVDMHTIPYGDERDVIGIEDVLNDDLVFVRYKALLETMAEELKAYSAETVALELINEPNYSCDKEDLKRLWQAQVLQLHQAVRDANAQITTIIPGSCYGSAEGLSALDPSRFDDDNIIWTFHSYEPFILTHQSAGWVGQPISAFKNLPYPPSELSASVLEQMPNRNRDFIDAELSGRTRTDAGWYIRNELTELSDPKSLGEKLKAPFDIAAQWADQHNIPRDQIFLGEFGFIGQEYGKEFQSDPAWRIAYLRDMINLAEDHGFGWSIWSFGGAFGMVQTFGGEPMPGNLLENLSLSSAH